MQRRKSRKLIIKVGACFCMLVLSLVFAVTSVLAWQTSRQSRAGLRLKTFDYDVSIYVREGGGALTAFSGQDIEISFENLFIGAQNSRSLTIEYQNNGSNNLSISCLFRSCYSALEEVPLCVDGRYYYMGSQIKVHSITAAGGVKGGVGAFLLETTAEGEGQATYIDEEITFIPALELITSLPLEGHGRASVTIEFIFADNQTDQSRYMSPFAGHCLRRLASSIVALG